MTWSHWLELIFAKQLRTVPRVTRVVVGDTRLVYYEPQDQTPASGAKAEWVQTSLFQGGFTGSAPLCNSTVKINNPGDIRLKRRDHSGAFVFKCNTSQYVIQEY